jgi:hypothetical protein
LKRGLTNNERNGAFMIMNMLATLSQIHAQAKRAITDAIQHVEARIEELVDEFTVTKEMQSAEQEIKNRIEQWEVAKERYAIRKELQWESLVSQMQKAYQDEVDRLEAEKARRIDEIHDDYDGWLEAGNWLQSGLIIGQSILGFGNEDLNPVLKPMKATMGIGIGAMNIANFQMAQAKEEELMAVTGGEKAPRPIFPRRPVRYIPTWHQTTHPAIGNIGYVYFNDVTDLQG